MGCYVIDVNCICLYSHVYDYVVIDVICVGYIDRWCALLFYIIIYMLCASICVIYNYYYYAYQGMYYILFCIYIQYTYITAVIIKSLNYVFYC